MAAFMECCLLILVLDKMYRHFKLLCEFLAILFFASSGVICFMAYLNGLESFDISVIFKWQHMIFLISAINFLVLFVLANVSFGLTMYLINDVNQGCLDVNNANDVFFELWTLLGLHQFQKTSPLPPPFEEKSKLKDEETEESWKKHD